jgi:hypothetical protein
MDYVQSYFGKPLTELQYADVESFFTSERAESDQIEFKSFNTNGPLEMKLTGIIEGITAFLNSSGGLLVWGAPEGVKLPDRKEKVFVGDLTRLPLTIEKDWLISKIVDKIIPLPRGIRVQLVAGANGQIVVFEIDESPYAPHQTSNVYYMRIDGQKKPAPHHYIEALFKKINFPRIEAYFKNGPLVNSPARTYIIEFEFLFYNFSPFINEENLSYRIVIEKGYFKRGIPELSYAEGAAFNFTENARIANNESNHIAVRYGHPSHTREPLIFADDEIVANGDIALIKVSFSGKTAPMRVCQYRLKFKRPNNQSPVQEVICSVDFENELLADMNQSLGVTEKDLLKQMGIVR